MIDLHILNHATATRQEWWQAWLQSAQAAEATGLGTLHIMDGAGDSIVVVSYTHLARNYPNKFPLASARRYPPSNYSAMNPSPEKKPCRPSFCKAFLLLLLLTGCAGTCRPTLKPPVTRNPPALATAELGFTCTFPF